MKSIIIKMKFFQIAWYDLNSNIYSLLFELHIYIYAYIGVYRQYNGFGIYAHAKLYKRK